MKNKVCHLTSVHTRYDVRIFVKECTSLANAGYDVSLIVNDNKENEKKNGVSIISTSYVARNRIDRILNSTKAIYKKAVEIDADLYHFHDPELLLIASKLKKKGKKVIFDSHEFTGKQIECRSYLFSLLRKLIAYLYLKYEEKVLHKLDAVIIPCTYDGKHYFEGKCRREVLIDNSPILDEVLLANVPFDERACQACYVGSISEERGFKKIVQASSQAKIPLILAGNFSDPCLKDEISGLKEDQYIKYLGVLGRKEVGQLLCKSCIGLCVLQDAGQYRHADNLPTKVCEYMAAGLPVIISKFPYFLQVVDKYKCGICVEPDDANSIAEAMKWLLAHPQEAEQMGKRGRMLVKEKLNWSVEEKKLFMLYKNLLDS